MIASEFDRPVVRYKGEPVTIERMSDTYAWFRDAKGRLIGAGVRHLEFTDS